MRIGVVFGSRSTEHDVSVASAYAVMRALSKNPDYEVYPIYISNTGAWAYRPEFAEISTFRSRPDVSDTRLAIDFSVSGKFRFTQVKKRSLFGSKQTIELDCIFPVLHGLYGEDGTVQGLCELLNVPYVSPSLLGSALGMNKIVMKDLFRAHNIPVPTYRAFHKGDTIDTDALIAELGFPLFVKPANLGSTIGVSRVSSAEHIDDAIAVAFYYDDDIVIEAGVQNLMELNCSVREENGRVIASVVEHPMAEGGFLTFEEKYTSEAGGTMAGLEKRVQTPAPISAERTAEIQEMAKKIYRVFFCRGGAPRIDFLYDKVADKLFVCEINTIPGALQMPLWNKSGITSEHLVRSLVETALADHSAKNALSREYASNVIDHVVRMGDSLKFPKETL